ncbi:regulator of RNase E activity RraA [Nitrobacteraceae bacterium AZCC 1564]
MPAGFKISKAKRKVSSDIVERFRSIPVANISDVMSRLSGTSRLRPMHRGGCLSGPALTVRTRPGDNLMVHKAIDMAEPGDVIVVDAGGELSNAIIGEIMTTLAERRGIAGFVIDGAIRDSAVVRASSFPVFAAGIAHRGPYKDGPGEINGAVSVAGMVVEAGDLIVADDDGVLCIPFSDVDAVLRDAIAKGEAEGKMMEAIRNGTLDRSWIDDTLRRGGCEIA